MRRTIRCATSAISAITTGITIITTGRRAPLNSKDSLITAPWGGVGGTRSNIIAARGDHLAKGLGRTDAGPNFICEASAADAVKGKSGALECGVGITITRTIVAKHGAKEEPCTAEETNASIDTIGNTKNGAMIPIGKIPMTAIVHSPAVNDAACRYLEAEWLEDLMVRINSLN
jgi:hypothetical protein